MSGKLQLIKDILVGPIQARRDRNQIKAKYKRSLYTLKSDRTVRRELLDDTTETFLGEWIRNKHIQATEIINKRAGDASEGYLEIYRESDAETLENLMSSVIWRIRIKNGISIVFWIIAVICILILLSLSYSTINSFIGYIISH